jgi:SAM-dependent methyltransferase
VSETPIDSQFARPRGALGRAAGWLMARTNEPMNLAAVELLAPRLDDRVLEIGFGPGRLVRLLAARAGFVAGVDISWVMVGQASRVNLGAIRQRRVELQQGEVSHLPYPDRAFTKACALNCFQFWLRPEHDLREVRRVLEDGGRLLLGLRVRDPRRRFMKKVGFTEAQITEAETLVRGAGFADVRRERRRVRREQAVYILAGRA